MPEQGTGLMRLLPRLESVRQGLVPWKEVLTSRPLTFGSVPEQSEQKKGLLMRTLSQLSLQRNQGAQVPELSELVPAWLEKLKGQSMLAPPRLSKQWAPALPELS